jgi:hypothetical protein
MAAHGREVLSRDAEALRDGVHGGKGGGGGSDKGRSRVEQESEQREAVKKQGVDSDRVGGTEEGCKVSIPKEHCLYTSFGNALRPTCHVVEAVRNSVSPHQNETSDTYCLCFFCSTISSDSESYAEYQVIFPNTALANTIYVRYIFF